MTNARTRGLIWQEAMARAESLRQEADAIVAAAQWVHEWTDWEDRTDWFGRNPHRHRHCTCGCGMSEAVTEPRRTTT